MFIERCVNFLKEGAGRLAIVLPDSIAINTSLQYVRDYILENTHILAIVSLPDYAFAHFGANVKSSLFFLQRKPNSNDDTYDILFAQANAIGYTPSGKPDKNNDLVKIMQSYKQFKKKEKIQNTDDVFVISSKELKGNRIDPKGYSPSYRRLKQRLLSKYKIYSPLKKLLSNSQAGDWGVDTKKKDEGVEYTLCYVLRNTNFDNDFNLDLSDVATRWIKNDKIDKLKLVKDDILVEKSGGSPYQPVGRVAIVNELPDDKPVIYSNFLQRVRVDSNKANPKYVFAYLRTLYHLGYMEYIQNQTTGIKNLLNDDFQQIQIPMIDEKKQEEFATKLIKGYQGARKAIKQAYATLLDTRNELAEQIK